MKTKQILTYDEVASYAPGNSQEQLVDVTQFARSIKAEYIKTDMIPITGRTIFVREAVARKLALVSKSLEASGYTLKVVYGYRSPAVQGRYFQSRKAALATEYPRLSDAELNRLVHNFVAVPDVAGHPTGGAVDVTLLRDNAEVDMGTAIADFTDAKKIKTYAIGLTDIQEQNRQILLKAMLEQGFAPFYGEWWHFSYGDREWAAFYDTQAQYDQLEFGETLITAAGGNGTAIQVIDSPLSSDEYAMRGALLGKKYENAGAEQAGFLVLNQNRLEMAGGEFCGNAARAAAVVLCQRCKKSAVSYAVSGFDGIVEANVREMSDSKYYVEALFPGLRPSVRQVALSDGSPAWIVDLGGIVHIIIEGNFPERASEYSARHRELTDQFNLGTRSAVGVVWFERSGDTVKMNPVVWVRTVDTFYYESSCGSGAIAVSRATGLSSIMQPSGGEIRVKTTEDAISLASAMQVIAV